MSREAHVQCSHVHLCCTWEQHEICLISCQTEFYFTASRHLAFSVRMRSGASTGTALTSVPESVAVACAEGMQRPTDSAL